MVENQIVLLIIIVGGIYLLMDEFFGKHKISTVSMLIAKGDKN